MTLKFVPEKRGPKIQKGAKYRAAVRLAFKRSFSQTADEVLEIIEQDALRCIDALSHKKRLKPGDLADIKRLAYDHLASCTITLCEPAPLALLDLCSRLMGVKKNAKTQIKNKKGFLAAAKYVALHPDASVTAVKRTITSGDRKVIKRWREMPEFKLAVARQRQVIKNDEFFSKLKKRSGGVKKVLLPP
ncbi:MAG: hypothetical protein RL274_2823 [Pseudomonadota bacterium]